MTFMDSLAATLPQHRVLRTDALPPWADKPESERYYCRVCNLDFTRDGLESDFRHVRVASNDWPSIVCDMCGQSAWTPVVDATACEHCSGINR